MADADFLPTASLETLRERARLTQRLRAFFAAQGFWEVETPLLSHDTVVDRHIDPYSVPIDERSRWLQTSPEFGMKRLLAAGADSIFQVCKAFRRDESGPVHNNEFTIVEWYSVAHDYEGGRTFLGRLAAEMFDASGVDEISYGDLFRDRLQIDAHRDDCDTLYEAASRWRLAVNRDFSDSRDQWLDLLLSECVQPTLGMERPVIVFDYPASQSALARVQNGDPPTASRFELFYRGVELANGYDELLDAEELQRRNQDVNRQRRADNRSQLPEGSRLLEAMRRGLPSCAGCALGWDRMVMLALNAESIDQVLAFPWARA